MKKRSLIASLTLLMVGVLGCDHATKQLARSHLRDRSPVDIVSGVLELTYTENEGAAFNLDRVLPAGMRKPLIILARLVIIPLVVVLWARKRGQALSGNAAFTLLLAGALGNFVEQLLLGHVTDFIHLTHWPVFNVADIALTAGAVLLLLSSPSLRPRPESPRP